MLLMLLAQCCFAQTTAEQPPATAEQPADAATAPSNAPKAVPSRDEFIFPKTLATAVQKHGASIDRLTKKVERVRYNDQELELVRPEITQIIDAAEEVAKDLVPRLAGVERRISELGEKPKTGEAPEAPAVAGIRNRLERLRGELQGAIRRTRLTQLRGRELLGRIQALQLANFGRDLRKRRASPLTSAFWQQLWNELPRFGTQVVTMGDNWWASAKDRLHWLFLIIISGIIFWIAISSAANSQIRHLLQRPPVKGPPGYLARVMTAVKTLPFLLAPGLITAVFIYLALWGAGLIGPQVNAIARSALKAIALFMLTNALAMAILLPRDPAWRLIGLPTGSSRKYLWLSRLLAGVYCLDLWLNDVLASLHVALPIQTVESLIANLAFALLLLTFAWTPTDLHAEGDEPGETPRLSARLLHNAIYWLRFPATIAVAAIVAASLAGYLALGRFIAGQVMLIGIGAAALLLGHLTARAIATRAGEGTARNEGLGADGAAAGNRPRRWAFKLVSLIINVLLIMGAASLLLLSWGISQSEIIGWGKSLLFGFEIGSFKFSLVQIIVAIVLFAAVLTLTRMFQSWLARDVLTAERVDRGIANSIHAGLGYLGFAIATLIGVSYAGVDLSNVALIASALSIGIGFGLNSIASNFVSGLIMLIERPIKVGDWVVVGNYQGYVRHISVRATEIETFDRASVIIPNSDFMTSAVQNWTHRNATGRVVVNIGASYSADPQYVMEVLRKTAADCDLLLKYPPPSVVFEEFGASSLDFSIRGYIADVNKILVTKTELRLAIAKAFRETGIEIPFPQQDVHLRDLDGVRELVSQALAKRAVQANSDTEVANIRQTAWDNDNNGDAPKGG